MNWHKADFQLQDGTKFTIMHALPKAGPNNIDDAFQYWCDVHLAINGVGTDPEGDFIRYINSHDKSGVTRASSLKDYETVRAMWSDPVPTLGGTDLMPFGQHKNKKLINVPADYLLYIYNANYVREGKLKQYITNNLAVLKSQARMIKR